MTKRRVSTRKRRKKTDHVETEKTEQPTCEFTIVSGGDTGARAAGVAQNDVEGARFACSAISVAVSIAFCDGKPCDEATWTKCISDGAKLWARVKKFKSKQSLFTFADMLNECNRTKTRLESVAEYCGTEVATQYSVTAAECTAKICQHAMQSSHDKMVVSFCAQSKTVTFLLTRQDANLTILLYDSHFDESVGGAQCRWFASTQELTEYIRSAVGEDEGAKFSVHICAPAVSDNSDNSDKFKIPSAAWMKEHSVLKKRKLPVAIDTIVEETPPATAQHFGQLIQIPSRVATMAGSKERATTPFPAVMIV